MGTLVQEETSKPSVLLRLSLEYGIVMYSIFLHLFLSNPYFASILLSLCQSTLNPPQRVSTIMHFCRNISARREVLVLFFQTHLTAKVFHCAFVEKEDVARGSAVLDYHSKQLSAFRSIHHLYLSHEKRGQARLHPRNMKHVMKKIPYPIDTGIRSDRHIARLQIMPAMIEPTWYMT